MSLGGAQRLRGRAVAEVTAGSEPLPVCPHVLAGPNDALTRPAGYARLCGMHPEVGLLCPVCHEAHCGAGDHVGTPCDVCWDLVATAAQDETVDLSLRAFETADGRTGSLNARGVVVHDLAVVCGRCLAGVAAAERRRVSLEALARIRRSDRGPQ